MLNELQDKILEYKKKNDFCILAHSYMPEAICEIADFTGDSYALARKAMGVAQKNVLMCGVYFMAETVKILATDKRVFISNPSAGCPMAEKLTSDEVLKLKEKYPDYAVVAYVNTTASLKALADVCVTSSAAIKICKALPNKNILFIPDKNLGAYVKACLPEKNFKFVDGCCPVHAKMRLLHVEKAKAQHPKAKLLVHPECYIDVCDFADFVGSTAGIMDYAINSKDSEFIIGTETAIVEHLRVKCPDKSFYPLSEDLVCEDMKRTTLSDILNAVKDYKNEVLLSPELCAAAKKSVEKMIELGG